MKINDWGKLLVSILLPLVAGLIGSYSTVSSVDTWYAMLTKPAFNPPDWIFAPVWTVLYVLMGAAFYLIWTKGTQKKAVRTAMWVFTLHLIVNCGWSVVFFGLHSLLGGLFTILVLLTFIVILLRLFYPISRVAAYLLMPYLLWVSFATVLNTSLWLLNR